MGARNGISGREVQHNAEISRRIEVLRVKRGVSKSELARAAGISGQLLYAYGAGISRWPVFRVGLIAQYLGVPVATLVPKAKSYVYEREIQEDLF
jgi:transcriptional regulator with XRE-family HTH domain